MLVARGHKTIQSATFRWALAFGRGAWCKVVTCEGLALDTRFVPAAQGPAKRNVCLLLLVRGNWTAYGADPSGDPRANRVEGPRATALTLEQLEGAERKRSFTFRAEGDVIELHFPEADLMPLPPMPYTVELDEEAWAIASRVTELATNDDETVIEALGALAHRLSTLGYVRPEVASTYATQPPKALLKIWRAVGPLIERLSVSSTIEDVVAGADMSIGQVERAVQRLLGLFGLVGPGFRAITYHVRMKAAVLFLSAEGVAVSDVAKLVGYGSADAMARSFRDAGLPPPSVIQRELLESR